MEMPISSTAPNIVQFPDYDDAKEARMKEYFAVTINAAVKVLNARLLCILALLGALAFWGLAMLDPTVLKIICGASYSLGVLWPVLHLYAKKS